MAWNLQGNVDLLASLKGADHNWLNPPFMYKHNDTNDIKFYEAEAIRASETKQENWQTIAADGDKRAFQKALYEKLRELKDSESGEHANDGNKLIEVPWVVAFIKAYEEKLTAEAKTALAAGEQNNIADVKDKLFVNKQTGHVYFGDDGTQPAGDDWVKVNDPDEVNADNLYAKVKAIDPKGVDAIKHIYASIHNNTGGDWRANFANAYRNDLTVAARQKLLAHADKATLKDLEIHFNTSGTENTQAYVGPTGEKPEGFGGKVDLGGDALDGKTLYAKFGAVQKQTLATLLHDGTKDWQKDFVKAHALAKFESVAEEDITKLRLYVKPDGKFKVFNSDDAVNQAVVGGYTMLQFGSVEQFNRDPLVIGGSTEAAKNIYECLKEKGDWGGDSWQSKFISAYDDALAKQNEIMIRGQKFGCWDSSNESITHNAVKSHVSKGDSAASKDVLGNSITVSDQKEDADHKKYYQVTSDSHWKKGPYSDHNYKYRVYEDGIKMEDYKPSTPAVKSAVDSLLRLGGNGTPANGVDLANRDGVAIIASTKEVYKQQIKALMDAGVDPDNIYCAAKGAKRDTHIGNFKAAMDALEVESHPYKPKVAPAIFFGRDPLAPDPGRVHGL
ncbi:hypothetical protein L3V83_10250 [Thiotrichales bacterium 19X7-9]|nr:hypothetical protein [Thiotrichales bacterium 19X7-9]